MGLSTSSIKSGASWSPTGGSDLAFVPDGRAVSNGVSLVVSADTNLATRRGLVCRATLPAMPANPNAFARLGRNSAVYRIPYLGADGKLYIQTIRLETAFHAEYTDKSVRLGEAVGILADSDFSDFWTKSLVV